MSRRRNPYTKRQIVSSEPKDASWRSVHYSPTSLNSIKSVESLNDHLQAIAAKHTAISISTLPSKENKRIVVVDLKNLARFYVFLSWRSHIEDQSPALLRIGAVGSNEEVIPKITPR